jgi:hypothetical protein
LQKLVDVYTASKTNGVKWQLVEGESMHRDLEMITNPPCCNII